MRPTGDRIDAAVRRDDTEAVARRGEVGEPSPATPGDVEGVDAREGPADGFAPDRDDLASERRRTRTAARLRDRRQASPPPCTGRVRLEEPQVGPNPTSASPTAK